MLSALLSIAISNLSCNVGMLFEFQKNTYLVTRINIRCNSNDIEQIKFGSKFRFGEEICNLKLIPANKQIVLICKANNKAERRNYLPKCLENEQVLYSGFYKKDKSLYHALKIICIKNGIEI